MARLMRIDRVTRRDRLIAYSLFGLLIVSIIVLVCVEMFRIISTRNKPPTTATFLDGSEERGGIPLWGRMPFLFVRSQKVNGTVACPQMSDVYFADTGLGVHAQPTFRSLSPPSCENIDKGLAFINFSMLVPVFHTESLGGRGPNVFEFPHKPIIDMRFAVAGTDGVDLFFAASDAPVEAVQPPWKNSLDWMVYIGGVGDLSDTSGQYVHTHVIKSSQPKKGMHWGFNPFGGKHVEKLVEFTFSGYHPKTVPLYTKSATAGVNLGWRITIPSSVMMERAPISILAQVFALISKVGGWLTVATLVFYIFFSNKYPYSEEELISQRLALRWHREDQRNPSTFVGGGSIELIDPLDTQEQKVSSCRTPSDTTSFDIPSNPQAATKNWSECQ